MTKEERTIVIDNKDRITVKVALFESSGGADILVTWEDAENSAKRYCNFYHSCYELGKLITGAGDLYKALSAEANKAIWFLVKEKRRLNNKQTDSYIKKNPWLIVSDDDFRDGWVYV